MTKKQCRARFPVGHITYETIIEADGVATYGAYTTVNLDSAATPKRPRTLFSGIVQKGMAEELRVLAVHFATLEKMMRQRAIEWR